MSFHCCVPNCASDARYDKTLSFHRFPSSKGELRKECINKIRRDVGPSFQVRKSVLSQLNASLNIVNRCCHLLIQE